MQNPPSNWRGKWEALLQGKKGEAWQGCMCMYHLSPSGKLVGTLGKLLPSHDLLVPHLIAFSSPCYCCCCLHSLLLLTSHRGGKRAALLTAQTVSQLASLKLLPYLHLETAGSPITASMRRAPHRWNWSSSGTNQQGLIRGLATFGEGLFLSRRSGVWGKRREWRLALQCQAILEDR